MIIDKLLTKYVDGEIKDISELIKMCPLENRKELEELIQMVKVFRRNASPLKAAQADVDLVFNHLDKIRMDQYQDKGTKLVANFRKQNLTDEEKDVVEERLLKILEEEFGEE